MASCRQYTCGKQASCRQYPIAHVGRMRRIKKLHAGNTHVGRGRRINRHHAGNAHVGGVDKQASAGNTMGPWGRLHTGTTRGGG